MAQLGERRVRIAEAEGSNPFGSTNKKRAEWLFFYWWTRGAHTFMQATGFSPDLTRKTTLTVFFHTIFPSEAAGRGRVGGLFGRSLGSTDFFMPTIEWVLTAASDCGRLLAEKLLLDFEEEVISPSGLRVWVLGEQTAFLVLLATKCSVP